MNSSALKKTIKNLPRLLLGFVIIALGINLSLYADLGTNPWGTFHQGISRITPLSFGQVTQLTGVVIILLSLIIKIYPGIGTILNMLLIGFTVDFMDALNLISTPDSLIMKILFLIVGTFLFNYGVYIYLSCELGAGPRDGLMVGLVKITGKSVSVIRPIIEVTIVIIGILLGGAYGVGTILNAFGGGYVLNKIFNFYNFNPKSIRQMVVTDYLLSNS